MKIVGNLVMSDCADGLVEILKLSCEEGKITELKVKWITATPIYSCARATASMFLEENTIEPGLIYALSNLRMMEEDEISRLRAEELRYINTTF